MIRLLRRKLANFLLRHLFSAILEEEILPVASLQPAQRKALASEARAVLASETWRRMAATARNKARERMFEKAVSPDDMFFGKAALYAVDVMEKRLVSLSKAKYLGDE